MFLLGLCQPTSPTLNVFGHQSSPIEDSKNKGALGRREPQNDACKEICVNFRRLLKQIFTAIIIVNNIQVTSDLSK